MTELPLRMNNLTAGEVQCIKDVAKEFKLEVVEVGIVSKTRMHSSRMRTAHLLPVSPSMHCSGGCTWSVWCTWFGGCTWSGGMYLVWGVYLVGGVPGPGGCTLSWGVYLVQGGCTWFGGWTWSWGVYLPGGVYLPRYSSPLWTDRHV